MEQLDINQLWRQVPPEEKFELMANAHSRGMTTALATILVGGTLAVCLKINWMLWGSILLSPVIFQGTASKAWRHLKPRVILEYLAARSAARRFAFSLNSNRLTVASLIRGNLEELFEHSDRSEELEAAFENRKQKDVWIALFYDVLVVISEQAGGAKLELGQLLARNIEVSGFSPSGQGEYTQDREIHLKVTNSLGITRNCKLSSKYPAALIVLEKQMSKLILEAKKAADLVPIEIPVVEEAQSDYLGFGLDD